VDGVDLSLGLRVLEGCAVFHSLGSANWVFGVREGILGRTRSRQILNS
jgi:hypothetical protein